MAKEVEAKEVAVEPKEKFYRSKLSGLKVLVEDSPNGDPTLIKFERFTPVKEKFQGDWIKVGYLKTSNPIVIEKLKDDYNVEAISEKEYTEAVK